MNKAEAWEHFVNLYGDEFSRAKIMELEQRFRQRLEQFIREFVESFREICTQIRTMQSRNEKGKISYITYSMLRTAILDRRPVYLVEAFDKDWFLDPAECQVRYHPAWAWELLYQLGLELEEKRKLYLNQISQAKLKSFILQETDLYHRYIIRLARYAMDQARQLPEFQVIEREPEFEVRVGEYLDLSELVYREIRLPEDPDVRKAWIAANPDLACTYGALTDLNLAQGDYWGIDLQYSDLRGSNLSQSNLSFSTLTGAKFNRASLAESDLQEAWIFEADFGECDLRGANLSGAIGTDGRNVHYGEKPGFQPVNFRGANLQDAVFKDAKLCGANFYGANLINTDFEGADLQDAVFAKSESMILNLSETQRQQISWQE